MLSRISLIVAILAGLAVGVLNFAKIQKDVVALQANLKDETAQKEKFHADLDKTNVFLKLRLKDLADTRSLLDTTSKERDTSLANARRLTTELATQTTQAGNMRRERDAAQQDLAAYKAIGPSPEQLIAMISAHKTLTNDLEALREENGLLGNKIADLNNQLDQIFHPDKPVYLPAALTGKVLVADPKWGFVILNVGREQGILQNGELLVNRNGRLVAKVIVHSIQKDRCVANVVPGWRLTDIYEGDLVIPAFPES